jgi:hypothetical protein
MGLELENTFRNPLAAITAEHVGAFVAHDLKALQLWIDVQRLLHLLQHHGPHVIEHGARGIDDEDDVFAVYRNSSDRIVFLAAETGAEQAFHFIGQRLLRRGEPAFELIGDVRFLLGRVVLAFDVAQVALQSRNTAFLIR